MDNQKDRKVDGHAYFIRKPLDILEIMQTTLSYHYDFTIAPKPYRIAKTIELPEKEYSEFITNGLLKDQEFIKADTLECYVNQYEIWQAIKVVNKDNPDESVLVQTEGAPYARYVGLEPYYPDQLKQRINEMTSINKPLFHKGNNWFEGTIDSYKVYAKVYPNPSEYGIDNGRISKLSIFDKDNNTIANYDRGWDVIPKEEHKDVYEKTVGTLEKKRLGINKEIQNRNKEYER